MTAVVAARPKRRIFAGFPRQIRHARDFVGRSLAECPARADAVLLVSELATNAVTHTRSGDGGAFTVFVYCAEKWARVEVCDAGSAKLPAVQAHKGTAEAGRGLGLVERIASQWGHFGGLRGRVVWFELEWE